MAHLTRMQMYPKEGRANIAPVRDGPTPFVNATEFEPEPNEVGFWAHDELNDGMQFGDEGPMGLGGCPKSACHARDCPAIRWYDMIEDPGDPVESRGFFEH